MANDRCEVPTGGLPAIPIAADDMARRPEAGVALCLSGGGYRAMLFHAGALWRLNDAGLLPRIDRISSVSGGSITAGLLGLKWTRLSFSQNGVGTRFVEEFIGPLRNLAAKTIDCWTILLGILLPGSSIGEQLTRAFQRHLFRTATLQDLPDRPRLVINATNVQSGVLWRFMKPYMRDYRVGEVASPQVLLAQAVAASAACPPFLSPVRLRLENSRFTPGSGEDLQREPYTTHVVLSDGGVYDNLGLETAWKRYETILVSDAGSKVQAEEAPKGDWPRHAFRVVELIDNQVRSLRKRQLIESYKSGLRHGAYWGIRTDIANYKLGDVFSCPLRRNTELAEMPTRLKRIGATWQDRLINWGFAVCDAALRKHVDPQLRKPTALPYPKAGV